MLNSNVFSCFPFISYKLLSRISLVPLRDKGARECASRSWKIQQAFSVIPERKRFAEIRLHHCLKASVRRNIIYTRRARVNPESCASVFLARAPRSFIVEPKHAGEMEITVYRFIIQCIARVLVNVRQAESAEGQGEGVHSR